MMMTILKRWASLVTVLWPLAMVMATPGCAGDGGLAVAQAPAEETAALVPERFPSEWLEGVRKDALALGVGAPTVDGALARMTPIPRVIELDRKQPEFTQTFWRYMDSRVTPARVTRGRELLKRHGKLLDRVAATYKVPPRFLVAFWGLESNFGDYTGKMSLLGSLATLAHDRRRADFFRGQLLAGLQVMDRGDIPLDAQSSWAGAMGQTQFIPTTYRDFAVDGDGDGQRDLWGSLADVFASSANYLGRSGWQEQETWGREVSLPSGFDYDLASLEVRKSLTEWQALGVRNADGGPLPQAGIEASIILPGGHEGPAFAVYKNFRVTLIWNRSLLYAIAVGHLADLFVSDSQGIRAPRPAKDEPLSRRDVMEIQRLLTEKGYATGGQDGIVGAKTRDAVRGFQRAAGLPADGYPTTGLLERLRGTQ